MLLRSVFDALASLSALLRVTRAVLQQVQRPLLLVVLIIERRLRHLDLELPLN